MTAAAATPRVMFWVQHLLGIGHRRRVAAIAQALVERGADVAFVTGGVGAPEVDPVRVRVVALPAVRAENASYRVLVDEQGREVDDGWRDHRRNVLLSVFEEHAPHVLVTESYPFGRRLLRFEVEPLVERALAATCRLVSSIRDVLQPPSKPSRARAAADSVMACYDAVLVHGDPAFVRLEESFPETERIRERIRYTGYVAASPGPAAPPGEGEGEVVVSAGGGVVAHRLVDTALESARLDDRLRWRILVGPNAGAQALAGWCRRASANVLVEPNRADFRSILSRARVSISQAGYNTVTDLLATGVRAVLVPFSAEGEREQSIRARVLADAGVARVVDEDRLSPETLLDSVRQSGAAADSPRRMVRLDGAAESAEALLEIARGVIDPPRR